MPDEQTSNWEEPEEPAPAPSETPDESSPTPSGTASSHDQCAEAKERLGDAGWALFNFRLSEDHVPIEQAEQAQAEVQQVQGQIDEIEVAEVEPYQRLNYWKQQVGEFEQRIRYYEDEIQKQREYIRVLNEEIARARALQSETGDPDKIFEGTIKVDESLIKNAEQIIQMSRDMIDALVIQLKAARKDLQKADDEILALEDKRQRLMDDLTEAKRLAAIASDRARKAQAEYDRLQRREQDAQQDVKAKCPPAEDRDG